jgi:hypothetical protein
MRRRSHFTFAAGSTIPVVITGIAARQWALEGHRLKGDSPLEITK